MNDAPQITAATIDCMGCRTEGAKFAWCAMCGIRSCASDKGFETCGECADMGSCPTLKPVLDSAPGAAENLAG